MATAGEDANAVNSMSVLFLRSLVLYSAAVVALAASLSVTGMRPEDGATVGEDAIAVNLRSLTHAMASVEQTWVMVTVRKTADMEKSVLEDVKEAVAPAAEIGQ
ncbi:unnamed protein product, partial [Meganyctiphanes norvegica]